MLKDTSESTRGRVVSKILLDRIRGSGEIDLPLRIRTPRWGRFNNDLQSGVSRATHPVNKLQWDLK